MFWDRRHSAQQPERLCSFCGKPQDSVHSLLASPEPHTCRSCRTSSPLSICEACVERCSLSL
ncbi:MAG TPA: hypothetical protein DCQ94_13000, partial [Nitrospira sp.]|nr:hypothetical protein [Nitrospira sp.]